MKRAPKITGMETERDGVTRQEALDELRAMPANEVFELAVRAGIYSTNGRLTKRYRTERRSAPCEGGRAEAAERFAREHAQRIGG